MSGWRLAHPVLIALLATLTAGCVVPLTSGDTWKSRQNIGDKVPDFVVIGKTTRADVLLALGEPDGASGNDERYTYTRITSEGGTAFFVPAGGGGGFSSEKMTYRRLFVFFDNAGRVTDARTDRTTCRENEVILGNSPRTPPCVSISGQDLLTK